HGGDYFRRFYADTALSGSAIGTRCGLDFFGADHALFGSDCPFDPEGGPMYIRVIDALDVTDAAREQIHLLNIRRLMRQPDRPSPPPWRAGGSAGLARDGDVLVPGGSVPSRRSRAGPVLRAGR
ncbi:hypothetical protein, partial [Nonomuraea angiospora]